MKDEPIYKLFDFTMHTTHHKELVCLGCGSGEIAVLLAKNAVSICFRCGRVEELPCWDLQKQ